jgi:hypothetical protein
MKKLLALLAFTLTFSAHAGKFEASLVVQTGQMRESDLIVRNITDLTKKKTCLTFYIRTSGTSPRTICYDAVSGFGANLNQVGHIKADDLVVRKLEDTKNGMFCMTAYVSTPGTSPAVYCYPNKQQFKDHMIEAGHLREGDLDVRRIIDTGNMKTCMVAYVTTKGTSPSLICYDSPQAGSKGGLFQASYLKEGDLVVRKVVDVESKKDCLITYVSTAGTSSHIYCYDE